MHDSHAEEVLTKWQKREVSENSWIVSIDEIKARGYDLSPKNPNGADVEALLSPEELLGEIAKNQVEIDGVISSLKKILKK